MEREPAADANTFQLHSYPTQTRAGSDHVERKCINLQEINSSATDTQWDSTANAGVL